MRKAPLLPLALALIGGLLAAHYMAVDAVVWLALVAAASLAVGSMCLLGERWRMYAVPAVLVAVALLGGLLGAMSDPLRDTNHWSHGCSRWERFTVRLAETPQPGDKSYRARASVAACGGRERRGDIVVYLKKDSAAAELRYGDRLELEGWADTVRRSVYTTGKHYGVVARDSTSVRARSETVRLRLLRRMRSGPLRDGGVAEALTLGWRSEITSATRAHYRDAGIAHLLAVSGLHVGLIAVMVGWVLVWVGRERRGRIVRGCAQLLAVWLFALLTGCSPSTVRAALMFSLFIVSDIMARRTSKLNILAAAAIVMLLAKPALLYDVGWQLSFSAVGGILLARPALMQFRSRLLQAAAVSTAATLATLPVVVAVFHRLPIYFLVANVVVVPMAGVLLGCSLLYMAVPCAATAWPVDLLLRGTDALGAWVQTLPGAVVEDVWLPPLAVCAVAVAVVMLLSAPQWLFRRSLSSR